MKFNVSLTTLASISALCASHIVAALPTHVTGPQREELEQRHATMEKRLAPLAAMAAGIYILIAGESAGEVVVGSFAQALATALGGNEAPWASKDNCRLSYSTHAGVSHPLWQPLASNAKGKAESSEANGFSSSGQANCKLTTTPAPSSGNKTSHANNHTHKDDWNVCPWIYPATTAPPVQYFNDP